jgi:hypothetical protein
MHLNRTLPDLSAGFLWHNRNADICFVAVEVINYRFLDAIETLGYSRVSSIVLLHLGPRA